MALSDGATSAKYALEAARITVARIISLFEELSLDEYKLKSEEDQKSMVIDHIVAGLRDYAEKAGCTDMREFSATALFLIRDEYNLLLFHLGDGAAFVADQKDTIIYVSEPENIGGSANRTYFSVSASADEHARIIWFNIHDMNISRTLITSDGAYLMFYNRGNRDVSLTVKELFTYIRSGMITTNEEFRQVLNQMAEVPSERLDDWSIMISDCGQNGESSEIEMISMLSEENMKRSD